MKTSIAFACLTYTYQGVSDNAFPYSSAIVASYAKKLLHDKIEIELFKYPDDFKDYLGVGKPKIVCFTNYSWTFDISYEFSKRIKDKFPESIIVFGGPNYPNDEPTQKNFLLSSSAIDFYIKREGEIGFVDLFNNLEKFNFNVENLKKNKTKIGNCNYVYGDELIIGKTLPRLEDLNDISSPYLSGLLDKFFDKVLVPSIQTSRGCPFKCTFCQEGKDYFTKICKFSKERIKEELEYIAKRVKVPNLYIVDSNFGMYKQDIEIAKYLSAIRKKDGWPKYIECALGKSKKVMEVISILEGGLTGSVAVQSTDKSVLENISRKNVPEQTAIEVIKHADSIVASSFSEVVLCLPEDTLEKHFKSMFDMMDMGANVVRSHQLLLLPDSEMYSKEYRQKYKIESRYRLQPKCFGNYNLYGESFSCAEIDELCVTNNTMPYEDYLKCRLLDLTVEIFYNNGVFKEYISLLNRHNILASAFIKKINEEIPNSSLEEFYANFFKENEKSLWKSKSELKKFIKSKGTIDDYVEKGLRVNEQLTYRAMAFFDKMEELHNIVLKCTKKLLNEESPLNETQDDYLDQLTRFSLLRKNNLLSLDKKITDKFHYDFVKISKKNFNDSPFSYFNQKELNINFSHSREQQELVSNYIEQYGSSMNNLGTILSRSSVDYFYRQIEIVN